MSEGSAADRKRVHAWISGTVQGVFYRDSTRREAQRLGLGGWVKNLPDGRVEAVFEGDPDAVDALVDWCRQPGGAGGPAQDPGGGPGRGPPFPGPSLTNEDPAVRRIGGGARATTAK